MAALSPVPQDLEREIARWRHVEEAIRQLLWALGQDPSRPGLLETPLRMYRGLREMTAGYNEDPAKLLAKTFPDSSNGQLVLVKGIEFHSLCEHHMFPFFGKADVAYYPVGRVVGLSKIARLVECFARRLQVQERLTTDIANAMSDFVSNEGVAVRIRARHFCMCARGVRKPGAKMVTQEWRGRFRSEDKARQDLAELLR